MTHFIGAVIVPADTDTTTTTSTRWYGNYSYTQVTPNQELNDTLTRILHKFDEGIEVPQYVEYTKEQLIDKAKEVIERYRKGTYAEFLADPAAYAASTNNYSHLNYLMHEFPKKLQWTREEIYQDEIKYYEEEELGPNGEVYSTYNPHYKWDWWTVGGRWEEMFKDRQGETVADFIKAVEADQQALKDGVRLRPEASEDDWFAEPDKKLPWGFPKNIVVEQGGESEWIAQGRVGWFGTFDDEGNSEEAWLEQALDVLKAQDQNAKVIYVDFHI